MNEDKFKGDFAKVAFCIKSIREISVLINADVDDLSKRMDVKLCKKGWADIAIGLNRVLVDVIEPVHEAIGKCLKVILKCA